MNADDQIKSLAEALRLSPDNAPLRRLYADTLARSGRHEAAEAEYRELLRCDPEAADIKLALAWCFYGQDKNSQALVIVEDLLGRKPVTAETYILHARLLLRAGRAPMARQQYMEAIGLNPNLTDDYLENELGVSAGELQEEAAANAADEEADEEESPFAMRAPAGDLPPTSSDAGTEIERPRLNFADVGGMESLKEEIRIKIIHPLTNPQLFKAYGKKVGGGMLMYGPPGCGKTFLARATAGEIKANFISVGIHDVLDMWIGSSEKQLHAIFDQARRNAPSVLFFDEVDALGASRTDMRQTAGRTVINQFLAELDGAEHDNEGVLVLGATNAPWHLDSAFRRPGRFDRVLFVPPPDGEARAAIVRLLLRDKPVDRIDYAQVGKKTEGFSGADLKAVIDLAVDAKLRAAMKTGMPQPLSTRDLLDAAKQVKPTTREWFASARNYALYANQGGAYDEILEYLKMK
ncbi:MAG: AAA family ATPase [Planctomycetes bacterium]|nr:AAA family ATPase [Planctomycetota bacterium]